MPLQIDLPSWFVWGAITQYKSADGIAKAKLFDGKRRLTPAYDQLLYDVRTLVQWKYNNSLITTIVTPETKATTTFAVFGIPLVAGTVITMSVDDPVLGVIVLATYTEVSGDTTYTILTGHLRTSLASNTHGYVPSGTGTNLTVTAPAGQGTTTNGKHFTLDWVSDSDFTVFAGGVNAVTTTSISEQNVASLTQTGLFMRSLIYAAEAAAIAGGGGCSPPLVTTSPASQTKIVGDSVTFTVVASGTGTLAYQWQKNLLNISGATASSYSKTNLQLSDAGLFRAIVTNSCGNVASNEAVLVVNPAPLHFIIGWSATDPYTDDSTPLNITNSQSIAFNTGSFSLIYSGSLAAFANTYVMISYPADQGIFVKWSNGDPATAANKGDIPDYSFRSIFTIGSTCYVCCRNPLVLDTTLDLRISHG